MNSDSKAIKTLSKVIINAINQISASLPYNCVKYGTIIADLGNGKYTVNIDNNIEITVPSLVGGSYSINDKIVILIPNNNKEKQFILGKIKYE